MTGTYVRGTLGIGFEPAASPGMQPILTPQVLTAAVSATNQPVIGTSRLTGVRLLILVQAVAPGASATITIAGLKPDGVTVATETTTAISTGTADANGNYYYCTQAVYGSINATGISASSYATALVSATVTVWGITSAKFLIPAICKFEEDFDEFSPEDVRGIMDRNIRMEQLIQHVTFDLTSSLYPEASQFLGPTVIGNVTVPTTPASLPTVPVTLHASAAISVYTTSFTMTAQPTNPGMMVQLVIASNALAGTITLVGTAWNTGAVQSEVINITAANPNGTFYSTYSYASLGTCATSGLTQTATLVCNGVFSYNPIYNPTNILTSPSAEWYSGTESAVYPYLVPEEATIEYDVTKELKFTMKGVAQNKAIIGDRTVNPLIVTNFPTYAQPIDFPIAGWPALFYLDPIGGTLGATPWLDIITMKILFKTGLVPYWTGVGQQAFNRVGRQWRETTFDATIDFTNVVLYDKYKAFAKFIIVAKFLSPYYLGVSGTTPVYKYLQIVMNARIVKWVEDPKAEKVMATLSGVCEYDPTSGYAFQASWMNQNNPAYIT